MTCIGTVLLSQRTPPEDKERKGQLMHLHKSVGVTMAFVIPLRLAVRFASKLPAHVPGPAWEVFAGKLSHLALYGLLIVLPGTGIGASHLSILSIHTSHPLPLTPK